MSTPHDSTKPTPQVITSGPVSAQEAARYLQMLFDQFMDGHETHGSPVPIGWTKHRADSLRLAIRILWANHSYPHMCRDGHPEIGWRGDGEMCPVCIAKAEGR